MAWVPAVLRTAVRLLVAVAVGFLVALLLPRQRWRSRPLELPSGPWPPLEASGLSGG